MGVYFILKRYLKCLTESANRLLEQRTVGHHMNRENSFFNFTIIQPQAKNTQEERREKLAHYAHIAIHDNAPALLQKYVKLA